jgi:hypothetical protein
VPNEATDLRTTNENYLRRYNGRRRPTYIVKPEGLCQGQGIYLSRNIERVIHRCSQEGGYVVQEYLERPHLVDDLKYDLRLYVLLYGISPMRVYIHEQGLARFATEPYVQPKANNLHNLFMHLTNYAINRHNANFQQAKGGGDETMSESYGSEEEEGGHKRSLHAILKMLYKEGADPDRIWVEIKDIVVKTMLLGQPYMAHIYNSCQPDDLDNSMCFQVLGFDIMIDKYFKPWLIEVNQSPSFATDSALDYAVKKAVLADAFKLVEISQEKREEIIETKARRMQERILTGKTDKMDPETKRRIREERMAARDVREAAQPRGTNGYELIYPAPNDEGLNNRYK